MDVQKPPRREREKLAQRNDVLDAALELFSSKGYRNVSMHEIAQKAEFAIGTLYKFFKNKDELYRALIKEQSDKFAEILYAAIAQPSEEVEKLRSYVSAKAGIFRESAMAIRLYFAETQGANFNVMAGMEEEIRRRHSDFLQFLAGIFESGIQKKLFKRIAEPLQLAMALDSLTNAFLFLWLDDPQCYPYPANPDVVLNILFKGLIE